MMNSKQRFLSALQVAASIVTMHYGVGMLIGTGQDIAKFGPTGMIYAISTALGTLAIIIFSRFYWQQFSPIWDLFKKSYGTAASSLTAFLSSFWMIGVVASFLVSGQAAAAVFGIPNNTSLVGILLAIYIFSLVSYGWLSTVFFAMLVLGSFFLLLTLLQIDTGSFLLAPYQFWISLPGPSSGHLVSVLISTVLLTTVGMDFHQFIVRAKTPEVAQKGIIIAAIILLLISFLLGGIILGALPLLPNDNPGATTLPAILAISGHRLFGSLWGIFVLPILFVIIGSGSGLLKIVAQSSRVFFDRKWVSNKYLLNAALLIIAWLISLTSRSVIGLITAFYAMYVGAVFVPFLFYLFSRKCALPLGENVFFVALGTGFISGAIIYITSTTLGFGGDFADLLIILVGSLSSGLVLAIGLKKK